MDNYNPLFLQHISPFIRVQLLKHASDETKRAEEELAKFFELFNVRGKVWDNSIIRNRLLSSRYLIEIGEGNGHTSEGATVPALSGDLAPPLGATVRAASPINAETNTIIATGETATGDPKETTKDHSILSPFNSLSDLFPNGILCHHWFSKYIDQRPFSHIQTFEFLADESSLALANRIKTAKAKFLRSDVKFVAIVISNSSDDEERITQLRQFTGLPRLTGLIYLNSLPETLTRDSELVVSTLLSNLRNPAIDFYSKIEYNIKQRHKKYYSCPSTKPIDTRVEISPKFLETRNLIKHAIINQFVNPHNLEVSLKILESSYTSLFEIVGTNFLSLSDCSEHDLKLYIQFRTLLDVLGFHIVRAYFSLEEPIEGFKKHSEHIQKVTSINKLLEIGIETNVRDSVSKMSENETKISEDESDKNKTSKTTVSISSYEVHQNWISIQYEWLAQLMKLVPDSILANLNLKMKKSKVVEYFGGVKINNDYITTDIKSLYLKSASYLKRIGDSDINSGLGSTNISNSTSKHILSSSILPPPFFNYLFTFKDLHLVKQHRLLLLQQAAAFESSPSFREYINYQIAEEFLSDGNVEEAIANFKNIKISPTQISQKLLTCFSMKNDSKQVLERIIELSCSGQSLEGFYNINELFKSSDPLKLDFSRVFEVLVLVVNPEKNETFMFDPCMVQLAVKSKFDNKVFQNLLPGITVEVLVDKIEVSFCRKGKNEFEPFRTISITHKTGKSSLLEELEFDEELSESTTADLTINDPKVLQFHQSFDKIGTYKLSSIKMDYRIRLFSGDKSIDVENSEEIQFTEESTTYHHGILYSRRKIKKTDVQKSDLDITRDINVPEPQKISKLLKKQIRLNSPPQMIQILQCRPNVDISTDFELSSLVLGEKVSIPMKIHYQPHESIKYEKLAISVNAKVSGSEVSTQVNWDSLKDDEALDLALGGEENHLLHIMIHPGSDQTELGSLILDFKVYASDEDVKVYDVTEMSFPILNKPFDLEWSVVPRFRGDSIDAIDMPSPFVVSSDDSSSMPIATRIWLAKVVRKLSDLEIKLVEYLFKSANLELKVEPVGEAVVGDVVLDQSFTTRSVNGFSHRNAPVTISLVIYWNRIGGPTNEFRPTDFEAVLPLSDPRVLVTISEDVSEDLTTKTVTLTYILENPTPRIFTFTTNLLVEDEPDWVFADRVPFKQPAFPVLPFSQHVIEFKGVFIGDEKVVKLPAFKVFDVQYKVGLPSLPVTDKIVIRAGSLYWRR